MILRTVFSFYICVSIHILSFGRNVAQVEENQINERGFEYNQKETDDYEVLIKNKKGNTLAIRYFTDANCTFENGEWQEFYKNGVLKSKKFFKHGEPIGNWLYYDKKGKLISNVDYSFTLNYKLNDCDHRGGVNMTSDNTRRLSGYDRFPEFENEGIKFIPRIMNLDEYFVEKYEGKGLVKILVHFEISPLGTTDSVQVCRNNMTVLEKEAARIITNSPKWKPALKNGQPAPVNYALPVVFVFP